MLQADFFTGTARHTLLFGADYQRRKTVVDWTSGAVTPLNGFDPVYGARPLKRAIQRWIENPLAQLILSGRFVPGSTITGSLEGDEIVFA